MVKANVLGQLLLMQSILINLPDKKSIFSFVCRGLMDIPGVEKADYFEKGFEGADESILRFPMGMGDIQLGDIHIKISDFNSYSDYEEYLKNFMFMVDVILSERHQREINELHQYELEGKVAERTRQLSDEIFERKLIEESLKESYALQRIAGKKAKLGGWSVNLEENRVYWSNEVARIHEVPPGYTFKLEDAIDFFAPQWRDRMNKVFKDCMLNGIPYEEEMEIITANGNRVWIKTIGEAVRDNDGNIIKVQGAFQDITERIVNEQKLRESEEKYRNFIENMQDGVYRSTPEGKFLAANKAMVEMLGYESKEELFAIDIKEQLYFSPHERDEAIFSEPQNGMAIFRLRKKDGSEIWVQDHGRYVYDQDGKLCYHEGTLRDITKYRQADDALRQAEIARESAKLKQNFLANMSHEIRTPLTGVLGMIEILEQTNLTDSQRDYLNTLKLSGENLKEIINQVLDFSKIEAGKTILKPIVFEPRIIISDVEMLFKNSARSGVRLKANLDSDLPDYIIADKIRIFQIVSNLVSNALKFTLKGSVMLNARLLSQKEGSDQVRIKIDVKDTGIGIPVHLQEKLFSPFTQIEDNDTRDYEGTGLGLSICKELVKLLGGEIGVVSEHGKGSTFWFTFPATIAGAPAETSRIKGESATQHKLIILFADDKVTNQKVVSLLLTSLGHEVTIANDGKHALSLFEPNKYDLILMDIQMPVMDGITATRQLKAKYKKLPPVVGLSANAFEGDREKYMALGMDEYLTKPIKKDDFRKLIQRIIIPD